MRATKVQSILSAKEQTQWRLFRQQGTYWDPLGGVHAFVAGLYNGGGMGKLVTLGGGGPAWSTLQLGFYRLKSAAKKRVVEITLHSKRRELVKIVGVLLVSCGMAATHRELGIAQSTRGAGFLALLGTPFRWQDSWRADRSISRARLEV